METNSLTIDKVLYSVEKLAPIHPGGDLFIKAFAGRDATDAFLSYHRRSFPHDKYAFYRIDKESQEIVRTDCQDYLDLCALVGQVVPIHRSFAPSSYFVKIAVLLSLTVGLEIYIHFHQMYVWYLTAPLGILVALVGLNVQHDANHGAISPHFYVNTLLGLSQSWIGGSACSWIHQHVVQHHIFCNDVDHDPDIVGNAVIKFRPNAPHSVQYLYQHLYFLAALALFGLTVVQDSILSVLRGEYFTPMSPYFKKYRAVDMAFSCLFVGRWIVLPLYQVPTLATVANVLVLYVVSGYYLSFFFLLSHNFIGTAHFHSSSVETFLSRQVQSSSNVGGPLLCWLNGGLNYQIEHHLFPRMHHSHYPKIAPIVREFCRERGISYTHFDTIYDNLLSTSRYLYKVGNFKLA